MGLVSAADSMTARQEGPRCSHDSGSTPGWLKGAKEAAEGGWEGCNMEAGILLDTLPESQTAGKAKRQDAWPPTTFTKVGRGGLGFLFPNSSGTSARVSSFCIYFSGKQNKCLFLQHFSEPGLQSASASSKWKRSKAKSILMHNSIKGKRKLCKIKLDQGTELKMLWEKF